MKKTLRHWAAAAVGAAAALAFSSCTYDPYYSSAGGSYSSGYGDGYGYGGSNFSTSLFVTTGDPRWGYDPYCYSYYDYNRHCYYDPYLNGYYPRGYRPMAVSGVPHPYGWSSGHGYIRPPSYVNNVTVVNYRNRESAYRNSNYSWSKQVRGRTYSESSNGRSNYGQYSSNVNNKPTSGSHSQSQGDYKRSNNGSRPSSGNYGSQNQYKKSYIENTKPRYGDPKKGRASSSYNTPVTREYSQRPKSSQKPSGYDKRPQSAPKPTYQKDKSNSRDRDGKRSKEDEKRLRSLGQG